MKRIIFNQKGGVGKSTISCNLAALSAFNGDNTLLIDIDPQANATHYLLGAELPEPEKGIFGFFSDMLNFGYLSEGLAPYIHKTPFDHLYILPSHPELEHLHTKLESRYKIYKLKEALEKIDAFKTVYFDPPPALNFFTRTAFIAADRCLVPFDCDAFSQKAVIDLLNHFEEIRLDHNLKLELEGVIVNHFNGQAKLPQRLINELMAYNIDILTPYLSNSIKVRESHSACMPLIHYAPKHKVTTEFVELFNRLSLATKNEKQSEAMV